MNPTYVLWMDIQDQIGQASLWPRMIRALFWMKNVTHWQRIMLATFAYVNGLNPEVFMEWVHLQQMCRDGAALNHFQALFRLFENGRNYRLYVYNVSQNQYQYLDGSVRHYIHASRR